MWIAAGVERASDARSMLLASDEARAAMTSLTAQYRILGQQMDSMVAAAVSACEVAIGQVEADRRDTSRSTSSVDTLPKLVEIVEHACDEAIASIGWATQRRSARQQITKLVRAFEERAIEEELAKCEISAREAVRKAYNMLSSDGAKGVARMELDTAMDKAVDAAQTAAVAYCGAHRVSASRWSAFHRQVSALRSDIIRENCELRSRQAEEARKECEWLESS